MYVYAIEFGTLDTSIESRISAVKNIDGPLKAVLGKYIQYGRTIFSPTKVD